MKKKILITDLPWRGKAYAGRAGMRWAHTSHKEPVISFRPFPFYLATAAAVLENAGHEVLVIDALAEKLSLNNYFKLVKNFAPDYIIAEIHTPSYNNDRQILKELKDMTDAKNIFVGPHPSALPEEVLKENKAYADYIVVSEYECTVKEIVEGKHKKGIVRQPKLVDINDLPWPARHLFKMHLYNEVFCRNYPNMQFMGSRGCPLGCSYCNIFIMNNFKRVHRKRDVTDIWDEVEYCIKKYKIKELYFDDDNIDVTPSWFSDFLDEKIKRGIKLPFTCMGHVGIKPELIHKMKKANCVGIKLGVESTNNEVLKRLKKGMTIEIAIKTVNLFKKVGIKTHLTFCIGLPGDTEDSIKNTVAFADKYGDTHQISIAAPFPGTPLYEEAKKEGWLKINSWDDFDGMEDAIVDYPNLSAKKLKLIGDTAQKNTYKKIIRSGEWKKYIKMIYQERGISGIGKLFAKRSMDVVKAVIK
jgi:anaerobic magnesium-protoporphyrin IX monomethyl ester cyclase